MKSVRRKGVSAHGLNENCNRCANKAFLRTDYLCPRKVHSGHTRTVSINTKDYVQKEEKGTEN